MIHFPLYKKLGILLVLVLACLYALPNVLTEGQRAKLAAWSLPDETLNLGLDLQGGSHLLLEVEIQEVFRRGYENLEDTVRQALREEKLNYRRLRSTPQKVTFIAFKPEQHEKIKDILGDELRGVEVAQEGELFTLLFSDAQRDEMIQRAMAQTLEILRMRVDEFGVAEPLIQRQGNERIIIELPGIDDVARAKSIIGRTAQLTFHLVDEDTSPYVSPAGLPAGRSLLHEERVSPTSGQVVKTPYVVHTRASLTGENLADARSEFDQYGQPAVLLRFDSLGTRKFARMSSENVGRRFAIVLDDVVYSAPVIREAILGGSAQITGNFTVQEADDLATVLRAGALPAPVDVVEERTVGPSLGRDSIVAGRTAVVAGFIAVLVLMLVFYHWFGLAANAALLFNVTLILGIMSALGATLTLPGIAGILLTIGMAVDANVLIFERIREEVATGKSPRGAMDVGFKSAFRTILDANITTLIAAIVLFAMGSGPIRGFALTLSVGIVSSMFTAIMVTRFLLVTWLKETKPRKLGV